MKHENMHIKKGDTIKIIAGKEKGKTGKVLRVMPKTGRAVIEKLNVVKRHQKPNQQYQQGGIIEKESGLHISNIALLDESANPAPKKATKAKKTK